MSTSMDNDTGTRERAAGPVRSRFALRSSVVLIAATVCCGLAVLIADRSRTQFDVTATREHRLSQRTIDLLGTLTDPYEIVVVADLSQADPASAKRTLGVLDNFARAGKNLRTTVIDARSPKGVSELDNVLERLVSRYSSQIAAQRAGLDAAVGTISGPAGARAQLEKLAGLLGAAGTAVKEGEPNAEALKRFFTDASAVCRLGGQDLEAAVGPALTLAGQKVGATPVPGVESAVGQLRGAVSKVNAEIVKIEGNLRSLTRARDAEVSARAKSSVQGALGEAVALRDVLARLLAAMDDLPRTPLPSVATAVSRSSTALVIGPPPAAGAKPHGLGAAAVDLATLFPPKDAGGAAGVQLDLRSRAEELIGGALVSLSRGDAPIVVLVHGENFRLAPEFKPMAEMVGRLKLRGVEIVEWPVAMDSEMPSTRRLDPEGVRPVVFVTISTASSTGESAQRFVRLSSAIKGLIDSGRSVLVSLAPSTLAATGQDDPMVSMLAPLGIKADAKRPLLVQEITPRGRMVSADVFLTDPRSTHPIAGPITNLSTRLLWTVPMTLDAGSPTRAVISIDDAGGSVWGESDWLSFRQVPPGQRASLTNPPEPKGERDLNTGPFVAAAAVERSVEGGSQRVVVVGSNGWFLDDITQAQMVVDNRPALANPGNLELLEGSIFWLAKQDGLIAPAPQSLAVATIPNLSEGTLGAIRWGLVGGLPMVVLIIGAGRRALRG